MQAQMLDLLDNQAKLTRNQRRLVAAATFGLVLEFLDFFLIGFIVAIVSVPWGLTAQGGAYILMSSGLGAIVGGFLFGRLADIVGRRRIFLTTITVFTLGTLALIWTPESPTAGPWYLGIFRFVIGLGAGGLYVVDLPLVQEFVPSRKRGLISGLVTAAVPIGIILGSVLVKTLVPVVGWRALFLICAALSLFVLLIRTWIPESPRWLLRQGRPQDAARAIAWALERDPDTVPAQVTGAAEPPVPFRAIFKYPRSLIASWGANIGVQTGYYGLSLWSPVLIAAILAVDAPTAAYYMIFVSCAALVGRILVSFLSERIGRRKTGLLCTFGAATTIIITGVTGHAMIGAVSAFIVMLMISNLLHEGGFATIGPYSAEVWPADLRTTGMGSAYGIGGIGKVIGPLGLAWVIGSTNIFAPAPDPSALTPAFIYFAAWYLLAGFAILFFGDETKNKTIEEVDARLRARGTAGTEVPGANRT